MKKIVDERVQQESHRVMAKNFRSAAGLLVLLLVVKAAGMLLGLPWYVLLPEACGLLCGMGVWAVWMSVRGLWGEADERVARERETCMSVSWTVLHCTALLVCTALMFVDQDNNLFYVLTTLAMTLIMYTTMGRMTKGGLYAAPQGKKIWPRVLCVTGIALVQAPVMMWLLGVIRQETYPTWMYILVEGIMLVSCLLGGVLASTMVKRSNANAEKQLKAAEGSDEE